MTTNIKLMVALNKLNISFHEPLKKNLDSLGVSSSVYLSLAHLASVDKVKVQKLGDIAQISSGTITHTVNKMLSLGYIERVQDECDRRVYWLRISPKGRSYFDTIHTEHMIFLNEMLSVFSDDEKKDFISKIKHFGTKIASK